MSNIQHDTALDDSDPGLGGDVLLTEQQAAALLNVTPRALQKWRAVGGGPQFVRISRRCIRYRQADLAAWTRGKLKKSTSDQSGEVWTHE